MRTRGISRTLSSIYYGEFYAESCVTLTYLKSWHIQNQRHTDSTFKHLSWNILFKFLCHPDVFRTLLYTPLWYILKKACRISKMEYFIKNPMAYLDVRCIRNIRLFRMRVCQLLLNPFHATGLLLHLLKILENLWFSDVFRGYGKRPVAWNGLMYQLFFRTTNLLLLLYPLLLIKSMTYSLAIRFFNQSLVMRYRALNNALHLRYLTEVRNFGCGLRVKRKDNYLYIRKCNNITNNSKKRNSGK